MPRSKLTNEEHAQVLEELREELRITKNITRYRKILATLAGMSGRGSEGRIAASKKANAVRWKKHVKKIKK